MADFDQGRAKTNAGSAPIAQPKPPIIPLKAEYVPTQDDACIVKQAYQTTKAQRDAQITLGQTQGSQKGYTKTSLEGILDAYK